MADRESRAVASLLDVVAVEHYGPGMVRVVSWSEEYIVDVRERRCDCPDMEYQLEGEGNCKHVWAALDATDQLGVDVGRHFDDDLDQGPEPFPDFEAFDPEVEYV
jgi:hypothetical protein